LVWITVRESLAGFPPSARNRPSGQEAGRRRQVAAWKAAGDSTRRGVRLVCAPVDTRRRDLFNAAYSDNLFADFMGRMERKFGKFPFRVAETPLIITTELRDTLARHASEIVEQLSEPTLLAKLKQVIPPHYNVPGMDALPNCVQVDFALVEGPDGKMDGRVVELQAFPSLYALMAVMADAWAETMQEKVPGLNEPFNQFIGLDKKAAVDLLARTIVGNADPAETVLVDYQPENQKTAPDFEATRQLFGVEAVCVTKLVKQGNKLFREKDGKLVQVKRIYNRMVFDELEVKGVKAPFSWNEELDVTWCSHPNWYWVWSKYSLPFLKHVAVPQARFLSDIPELPADLSRYVLKPLFSFAGSGVVVDVTPEDVAKVPADQRDKWVLQEKIDYAPAIRMPDGAGVKAEVRIMLARPPDAEKLTPVQALVRLSRGKMIGVDHNKNMTWVGGSVGLWAEK
jgi:hypothetical protein